MDAAAGFFSPFSLSLSHHSRLMTGCQPAINMQYKYYYVRGEALERLNVSCLRRPIVMLHFSR